MSDGMAWAAGIIEARAWIRLQTHRSAKGGKYPVVQINFRVHEEPVLERLIEVLDTEPTENHYDNTIKVLWNGSRAVKVAVKVLPFLCGYKQDQMRKLLRFYRETHPYNPLLVGGPQ